MPGTALRAPRRRHGAEGASAAASPEGNPAAWLFGAWPGAARPGTAHPGATHPGTTPGGATPGNRHSRRVALLKRVLPAIGLALLLLIAVWPRLAPLWERMRLAFPAIDLREAGELRMIDPRYSGTDRLGRPFVVTAAVGRQVPDRQDLVSLEGPRADMKTHRGADIVLDAATGIYQSQAQLLDLFGQVTLVHQNGTRFVTDTARVDVANNTAEGSDPIAGEGPSGDIKADGFRILDKGDTIIFTGKSDMLLKGAKAGTGHSAPAALPAPIAAAAAHVAAAAKPALAAVAAAAPAKAGRKTAAGKTAAGKRPAQLPEKAHPAATRKRPAHDNKALAHAKPAAMKKS